MVRRVEQINNLLITTEENIMVIDNGCDQTIINNNSFLVQSFAGVIFNVGGALQGMSSSNLELVNEAYTLATLCDSTKVLFKINQCFLDRDPMQTEALLQPHQMRAYGVVVDDCAKCHISTNGQAGSQQITVGNKCYPMNFDGWKCYFRIRRPTAEELLLYPIVELTSPLVYEPQRRVSRRLPVNDSVEIEDWRARLGFPTYQVTRDTLQNTTHMIQTLQAGTREYMRDHYKTRVWALCPKRINDTCYSDTFFSSVVSIRRYKCFQLFAFKASNYDVVKLMKREAEAPAAYEDIIRHVGAPNKTVTDNAKVLTGAKWTNINRRYCIETGLTVPHHQHQNYSEGVGGNFKLALLKLYHNTPHAPLKYWCYAASFLDKARRYLSKASLNGRCGFELINGETADISIFWFKWFAPIWYYNPSQSFPHDKMLAGFFLDIADNTGDGFSYEILPATHYDDIPLDHCPITLIRSVVRLRDYNSTAVPRYVDINNEFTIFNQDGDEIFEHEENIVDSEESSNLPIDTIAKEIPSVTSNPLSSDDAGGVNTLSQLNGVFHCNNEEQFNEVESLLATEKCTYAEAIKVAYPTVDTTPIDQRDHLSDNNNGVPIISQTQPVVEDVDSDNDDSIAMDQGCIAASATDIDHDDVVTQINTIFDEKDDYLAAELVAITDNRITTGILELLVEYSNGETTWHPIEMIKCEDPQAVAQFVLSNDLGHTSNQRYGQWARLFLRSLKRTLRRLRRSSILGFTATTYNPSPKKLRSRRGKSLTINGKAIKPSIVAPTHSRDFKFGLEVPKSWQDIIRIDTAAGNRTWQDAIEKEIAALIHHQCFDFKSPDYKPSGEYQYCRLHFVYDIKSDLRYKARLVCDGSRIDPRGLSTRATVVKGISVRLLDLVADSQNLSVLCGDIGNAFIQATTNEKVFTKCGPEFGDRQGAIAIISRALYGLTTSAERFRTMLADFLRTIGFKSSRFDRDVWMRMRDTKDGYDYICTHVDDFKVVAKDPNLWVERIASIFLIKEHGPRNYYLGNDYTYHENHDMWTYGVQTYAKEAVARVERLYGCLPKQSTPLSVEDCHPEMDTSPLLGLNDHRKFQMLLGMLQWMVTIGKPELTTCVSSLNRFGSNPREYHLELIVRAFGYVKTVQHKQIAIDSRPMVSDRSTPKFEKLIPDFLNDYPDASEEMDPSFPEIFGPILQTTILVDSDHAHDLKTRRSLTGLLAFVGSTPVMWLSKRQGSIASSTYAAEFSALRTATEEALSLRYMLRCLGCNIPSDGSSPTRVFGDNLSVIQNVQNPAADLSKKHVAISFHVVREAVAARIIEPFWLKGRWNLSDLMTKQIPRTPFKSHCDYIYWRPNFHLTTNNRLDESFNDN